MLPTCQIDRRTYNANKAHESRAAGSVLYADITATFKGRRVADLRNEMEQFNFQPSQSRSPWLLARRQILEDADKLVRGFIAYLSEAIGRTTVNVLPLPSSLSAVIEPFCSSRIFLVSERPSPAPE
jgi:hypothetical protein